MTGSPGPEAREAAGGIAGEVGLEQRDRNSDNNVRKGEGASSVRAEFSAQARDPWKIAPDGSSMALTKRKRASAKAGGTVKSEQVVGRQ